jgi:hypothetical protein
LPAKVSKRRTCRSKACPRRRPQHRHREQALLPQKQSSICPRRCSNAEPVGARLAREGVLRIAIASKLCSHKSNPAFVRDGVQTPNLWEQGLPAKASSGPPSRASFARTKAVPHLPAKVFKRRTCRSEACPRRRSQDRHREQALLPQKQFRICPRRCSDAEPVGARLAREGVFRTAIASKLCSHKSSATNPTSPTPSVRCLAVVTIAHLFGSTIEASATQSFTEGGQQ